LSLEEVKAQGNYPAKKDARAPRNRWFRQFCGYPPPDRRGQIGLQDGKLQKNRHFAGKTGREGTKIDEIFPNDFDKKVKGSS
jgi:hypothetical protein